MSKFKPNMAGQSVVDRVLAAKHTVAGQSLAKVICKATTEEVMGPKRKHLDYLLQCTNEPNVSVPEMANILIERTQNSNWVVVFKALITVHNLMNYGNERFTQYLASNNCTFNLTSFTDRSGTQGYDMSTYIRRYAKYLNEKAFSYRQMAFDFVKVKRGKEDGLLRTMNTDKLLKTLPVLQSHLDALVEFDVSANELTNGVINAAFMLLFKDLIRLFACYNDGIINLLEKYFEMNKKSCRDALEIYKKFLARMDRVCEFLKVAENVGIDKGDIPDLAKAPASLLEALEQHLNSLESCKKGGSTLPSKPSSGLSTVISNYAAAAQIGAAPGAGAGVTQITDEERRRILEDEQRQLDQMKQQRLKQMASGSPVTTSNSMHPSTKSLTSPTRPPDHLTASVSVHSSPLDDDLFSMTASQPTFASAQPAAFSTNSTSLEPLFGANSTQATFGSNSTADTMFGANNSFAPSFGANPAMFAAMPASNPFAVQPQPVMVMPPAAWTSPVGTQGTTTSISPSGTNNVDAKFAAAFGSTGLPQKSGYDGFGEVLRPSSSMAQSNATAGLVNPSSSHTDRLIQSDLDGSLALLAGNLNIRPDGQMKKTDHQWSGAPTEKRLTGASGAAAGTMWAQQPSVPAGYPAQMSSVPGQMLHRPPLSPTGSQYWVPGVQPSAVPAGVPPTMMSSYPVAVGQPMHPAAMMAQPVGFGWPQAQPQMIAMGQPNAPQSMRAVNAPNDPFGSL